MTADRVTVTTVTAARVLPLRHAVLRPGRPEVEARYDADDAPTTVHVAALEADGTVVACGTFFPEMLDDEPAWRLRGMATDPAYRGRGLGSAVLRAGIEHVRREQGQVLWCNARRRALSLYQRAGFETMGEEFEVPGIGPHYRAVLRLGPSADQANSTDS